LGKGFGDPITLLVRVTCCGNPLGRWVCIWN
jgi:hypothetical protein